MHIFNLPDLGEGLADAEIHEWFVAEGDTVALDQPLVSMETAKAVVEVPSPQSGVIQKLYGQAGDTIQTGAPLVGFSQGEEIPAKDQGSVVGTLTEGVSGFNMGHFKIGTEIEVAGSNSSFNKATPTIKRLAKQYALDLTSIQGSGEYGMITKEDIEKVAAQKNSTKQKASPQSDLSYEPLRGVRKAMCQSMVQAHQQIVPVSIFDEADLHTWPSQSDLTVRLIKALLLACEKEPALNAWFNGKDLSRYCFEKELHLGLAIDDSEGLFVPVLHDVKQYSDADLRIKINALKEGVHARSLSPQSFQGATITLSNFGKFAGRYATPIIVPPMVAILAVGRMYQKIVPFQNELATHPYLPLSLSFDHRAVTGGEASRFLGYFIEALEQ